MARGSSGGLGGGGGGGAGLEMIGETGQLDARGRAVIRKKFFVSSESDINSAPNLQGYRPTEISYTKLLDNAYEKNVEYTATVPAGSGPVETLNGTSGTFEMFCSYESRPIELHPKIAQLSVDYGGYFTPDGFAKWPPFYTPGGSGGLGGSNQKRNPMFGVTRYKDVTMTFRHTYYSTSLPRGIYDQAGKIVTSLPAGFPTPRGPSDSDGREIPRRWMIQMPAASREGNSYKIVQEYVLLDSSGITNGLYETSSVQGGR